MDPSESFFGWDMDESELGSLNVPPLEFIPTGEVPPGTYVSSGVSEIRDLSSMEPSELIRDAQPPDTPWVSFRELLTLAGPNEKLSSLTYFDPASRTFNSTSILSIKSLD